MMVSILVKAPCELLESHMISNTIDPPSNATNLSKSQCLVTLAIEEGTQALTDRNDWGTSGSSCTKVPNRKIGRL